MKIYLIRHGQTTGDLEDRYGGDYDDHLSEEGNAQAKHLADKLKHSDAEIILCSPRIRAQETASYLKDSLNCEIKVLDDLRERNQYGVLTGLVKADAKEKYPQLIEDVKNYRNTIEGAESYDDFQKRIEGAFKEVLGTPNETIAVLTHGGPIRVIFREILKLGEVDVADCGYAVLNKNGEEINVEKIDGIELRTD